MQAALTLTLALTLIPTLTLTLTLTPTQNPNHNQVNDLHAIYLQRPKTHENMPPRTKTVNQQELRR